MIFKEILLVVILLCGFTKGVYELEPADIQGRIDQSQFLTYLLLPQNKTYHFFNRV